MNFELSLMVHARGHLSEGENISEGEDIFLRGNIFLKEDIFLRGNIFLREDIFLRGNNSKFLIQNS